MNIKQTVTDRAYNQIKTLITNLGLKLGQRIDIKELANRFNISQTPIREALSLLVKDELIEYKPRQGYYVVNLSYHDIEEIYELRKLIECFALKQALKDGNIDKSVFNHILVESKSIQKEVNKENKLLNYHILGRELHLNIVKSCSNNRIYSIYLRIYPIVNITQNLDKMYETSLCEHVQIAQNILNCAVSKLNCDALKAVNFLRHHINNGKKRGLVVFKQQLERKIKNI